MKDFKIDSATYMCSFDINSFFTVAAPLADISAETLYDLKGTETSLVKNTFIKLLRLATKPVEFRANSDQMYQQLDGVEMGCGFPLGPILVNIFVGFS